MIALCDSPGRATLSRSTVPPSGALLRLLLRPARGFVGGEEIAQILEPSGGRAQWRRSGVAACRPRSGREAGGSEQSFGLRTRHSASRALRVQSSCAGVGRLKERRAAKDKAGGIHSAAVNLGPTAMTGRSEGDKVEVVVVVVVTDGGGGRMASVSFLISGKRLTLANQSVRAAVRDLTPEPARAHVVVIDGTVFPVKQAFAAATGLDRLDFTTNQARTALKRLGFTVRRVEES